MVALLAMGLSACNQGNPSDSLLFTGKYVGAATFDKSGDNVLPVVATSTEITVLKVGEYYNFRFAAKGIPALMGVKLEKGKDILVTLSDDAKGVIKITGDNLNIAYTTDDGTWTVPSAKRK